MIKYIFVFFSVIAFSVATYTNSFYFIGGPTLAADWYSGLTWPEYQIPTKDGWPHSRDGTANFIDNKTNSFYMFGGQNWNSAVTFADMWKYNINTGYWTWLHGVVSGNAPSRGGEYPGIYNWTFHPGGRFLPYHWKVDNKFYLLGGFGCGNFSQQTCSTGPLNDMWIFDLNKLEYTFHLGDGSSHSKRGVYGTRKVFNSSNYPGSRYAGMSFQLDWHPDLLFFGFGTGWDVEQFSSTIKDLNDIFAFNITSSQFAWISGNVTGEVIGHCGTKNVPSIDNYPGGRSHPIVLNYKSGILLFGGQGFGCSQYCNRLSDLWYFNEVQDQWTWYGGGLSVDERGQFPLFYNNFGIQYWPPGRYSHMGFNIKDKEGISHYIFGAGWGMDSNLGHTTADMLSDWWEVRINQNENAEWGWIYGSNIYKLQSSYPSKSGDIGILGARDRSAIFQFNDCTWLFGGLGYDEVLTQFDDGNLRDLWRFSVPFDYKPVPSSTNFYFDPLIIFPSIIGAVIFIIFLLYYYFFYIKSQSIEKTPVFINIFPIILNILLFFVQILWIASNSLSETFIFMICFIVPIILNFIFLRFSVYYNPKLTSYLHQHKIVASFFFFCSSLGLSCKNIINSRLFSFFECPDLVYPVQSIRFHRLFYYILILIKYCPSLSLFLYDFFNKEMSFDDRLFTTLLLVFVFAFLWEILFNRIFFHLLIGGGKSTFLEKRLKYGVYPTVKVKRDNDSSRLDSSNSMLSVHSSIELGGTSVSSTSTNSSDSSKESISND